LVDAPAGNHWSKRRQKQKAKVAVNLRARPRSRPKPKGTKRKRITLTRKVLGRVKNLQKLPQRRLLIKRSN